MAFFTAGVLFPNTPATICCFSASYSHKPTTRPASRMAWLGRSSSVPPERPSRGMRSRSAGSVSESEVGAQVEHAADLAERLELAERERQRGGHPALLAGVAQVADRAAQQFLQLARVLRLLHRVDDAGAELFDLPLGDVEELLRRRQVAVESLAGPQRQREIRRRNDIGAVARGRPLVDPERRRVLVRLLAAHDSPREPAPI